VRQNKAHFKGVIASLHGASTGIYQKRSQAGKKLSKKTYGKPILIQAVNLERAV
jgi:hypothetical protein